ncbi:diaminobutyrate acetyltransferase [Vibrio variabilis]|uniref:diaminobutyrate acetyltransferase n=1 Tax=Vibrio variabilis TaxID=990271 RepID=UPI000DD8BEBD|nr:diaminobutyrate acetyltransferase [Vibrio variabilis]
MHSTNKGNKQGLVETETDQNEQLWRLQAPSAEDGLMVNKLVAQTEALDDNSTYCNFLQAIHFHDTSIAAFYKGRLAGFVSGYLKPNQPNTLFIWQVVVDRDFRGQGVAKKMLSRLLDRDSLDSINAIETTITEDNLASWSLFRGIERERGQAGNVSVFLDQDVHFEGQHETEHLYRILLKNTH